MSTHSHSSPPQLFLSYAHRNSEWRDLFLARLEPIVTAGALTVWHDTQIEHGDDWFERIAVEIQQSRFVVLLLTADFLASDFIRSRELPYIEEIRSRIDLTIYPWVCEPCGWQHVALFSEEGARIQCRPAIGSLSEHDNAAVEQMLGEWVGTLTDRANGLLGRPRLEMQREESQNAFDRGKASLVANDFRNACASFEEAARLRPGFADAYYFHALALLAGRRAKKVNRRTITQVEEQLRAAIDARGSFLDLFMLALFKWDYYQENKLRMPPPSAEHLLEVAVSPKARTTFSQDLLDETFQHTPWFDSPVTNWLTKEE